MMDLDFLGKKSKEYVEILTWHQTDKKAMRRVDVRTLPPNAAQK